MKSFILNVFFLLILSACASNSISEMSKTKLYCYDNYSQMSIMKDAILLDYEKDTYYLKQKDIKNSFVVEAQSCIVETRQSLLKKKQFSRQSTLVCSIKGNQITFNTQINYEDPFVYLSTDNQEMNYIFPKSKCTEYRGNQ